MESAIASEPSARQPLRPARPARRRRSGVVVVSPVAATAAGLTLLAGGVAAAEPVQDDESGLALGSFDLDAPTPAGPGRLFDDGPDALPAPFPIEPGRDVAYGFAHDVSITPFRPAELVFDEPAASPVRLLPEPTDGLDSVLPVGDAAVGIVPVRGGAIEDPQPLDAHVVVPDPSGRIGGGRADRPLPPEPTVPVPLLSDKMEINPQAWGDGLCPRGVVRTTYTVEFVGGLQVDQLPAAWRQAGPAAWPSAPGSRSARSTGAPNSESCSWVSWQRVTSRPLATYKIT